MKIGIDPGISGALALLKDDNSLIEVVDMPIMSLRKGKNQVNAAELGKVLTKWRDWRFFDVAGKKLVSAVSYLEDVHSMPGQGVSACFSFGASFGAIQGVLGALEIPVVLVTPQSWKKKAGLIGKDKDMCRTLMQRRFPQAPLSRKKDIGRADAIAIALYGS